MITLKYKIAEINSKIPTVMFDEDLDLITDRKEKELKELKRIVQDCCSSVECEGSSYIPELEKYTDKLYKLI